MAYEFTVKGDLHDGVSIIESEELPSDYLNSSDFWEFRVKAIDLSLDQGHDIIDAVACLWLNLYDDMKKEPVFKAPLDTTRTDLANIRESGGKKCIYIRGMSGLLPVKYYNRRIRMKLDMQYRWYDDISNQSPRGTKAGRVQATVSLKIR